MTSQQDKDRIKTNHISLETMHSYLKKMKSISGSFMKRKIFYEKVLAANDFLFTMWFEYVTYSF